MNEKQLRSLKEGDNIRLNKKHSKKFSGRFNSFDTYKVKSSRSGMMIADDSGVIRFLNEYFIYFDIL